eukprot:g2294.t1
MGVSSSRSVIPVVQNFDSSRYLGVWWERARAPNPFQSGAKARAEYSLPSLLDAATAVDEDDSYEYIAVENSALVQGGSRTTAQGRGRIAKAPEGKEGHLEVKIGNQPFWGSYDVLETDYERYALVYSRVRVLGITLQEYAWVLERAEPCAAGKEPEGGGSGGSFSAATEKNVFPETESEVRKRVQRILQILEENGPGTNLKEADFIYTDADGTTGEGN